MNKEFERIKIKNFPLKILVFVLVMLGAISLVLSIPLLILYGFFLMGLPVEVSFRGYLGIVLVIFMSRLALKIKTNEFKQKN